MFGESETNSSQHSQKLWEAPVDEVELVSVVVDASPAVVELASPELSEADVVMVPSFVMPPLSPVTSLGVSVVPTVEVAAVAVVAVDEPSPPHEAARRTSVRQAWRRMQLPGYPRQVVARETFVPIWATHSRALVLNSGGVAKAPRFDKATLYAIPLFRPLRDATEEHTAVIVGAALVDAVLQEELAKALPQGPRRSKDRTVDLIAEMRFAARIELGYRLDLYAENVAQALTVFRDLRNIIAHDPKGTLKEKGAAQQLLGNLTGSLLKDEYAYEHSKKLVTRDGDDPKVAKVKRVATALVWLVRKTSRSRGGGERPRGTSM